MAVLPVHSVPSFIHQPDKGFPAGRYFLTVQDCQGNVLHIAFDLSLLCLFQKLVGVFTPCHCFLSFRSFKGLSLFRDVQPLLLALCVAPLLQLPKVGTAPLELVPVLKIDGIDDKVRMDMVFVLMGSHKHLKPFPCRRILCKL